MTALVPAFTEEQREGLRLAELDELCVRRAGAGLEGAVAGSLQAFVRRAWPIVEPAKPLVWNWHLSLLCEELERVTRGETRELVIALPPGSGKSIITSALWPAWMWLHNPALHVLAVAHTPLPVTRDALRQRDILLSAWFRGRVAELARRFPRWPYLVEVPETGEHEPWSLRRDQAEKINYMNTARGQRLTGSMSGGVTGTRVDGIIVDDPYNAIDALLGTPAQVAARMEDVITTYDGALFTRIDSLTGWRVTIMQRLHERDLAGELLRRGVRSVVVPFTRRETDKYPHPRDPRKPGAIFFAARFPQTYLDTIKAGKGGAAIIASQFEQAPKAGIGRLFRREWFTDEEMGGIGHRYRVDPLKLGRTMDELAISIDCTFKKTATSDRVCLQVWGRKEVRKFLLDQVCERMSLAETCIKLVELAAKWPRAKAKLLEMAANGPAVKELLDKRVGGIVPVTPQGGKFARAQASAVSYEAGEVWLPAPEVAPWIGDFVERHVAFTGEEGGEDDEVDAESQLIARWDGDAENTMADTLERTRRQFGFLKR